MSTDRILSARTAGLVALGATIGAGLRHGANQVFPWDGTGWPWATFVVNAIGCAAIAIALVHIEPGSHRWALVAPGALGGLTTMSTFLVEAHELWAADHRVRAVAYVVTTLAITVGTVDIIGKRRSR